MSVSACVEAVFSVTVQSISILKEGSPTVPDVRILNLKNVWGRVGGFLL